MVAGGAEISEKPSGKVMLGILMKVISVALFIAMYTLLKAATGTPAGELTFFRSFFGLIPVFVWVLLERQAGNVFYTRNIGGHIGRGLFGTFSMLFGFFAVTKLPLPDVVAINYGEPMILVALCAVVLKEKVGPVRWLAVFIGLIGVLIIAWPNLTLLKADVEDMSAGIGAVSAIMAAISAAFAMLLVRKLVFTEKTTTIVLYFMITSSTVALLTIPLGLWWNDARWIWPHGAHWFFLIGAGLFGGVAQIFMTQAYRYAEPSTVAPFEYSAVLMSLIVSYVVFKEIPTYQTLIGACIIVCAGLVILYRESLLRRRIRRQ